MQGNGRHSTLYCPVDRHLLVRPRAALTTDAALLLDREIRDRVAGGAETITLDLGGCPFVDSDGFRWVQGLHSWLKEQQLKLELSVCEGSRVERAIELLQLDATLKVSRYPVDTQSPTSDHSRA